MQRWTRPARNRAPGIMTPCNVGRQRHETGRITHLGYHFGRQLCHMAPGTRSFRRGCRRCACLCFPAVGKKGVGNGTRPDPGCPRHDRHSVLRAPINFPGRYPQTRESLTLLNSIWYGKPRGKTGNKVVRWESRNVVEMLLICEHCV
jgi:hypothetical protein